jgi:hypothetical protein
MIEPFINTGKDKLVCRYCGDTVLPGATHYCREDLKKHAGEVLLYNRRAVKPWEVLHG